MFWNWRIKKLEIQVSELKRCVFTQAKTITDALAEYERLKRDRDEAVATIRFYEDAIVDLIQRSGPLTATISLIEIFDRIRSLPYRTETKRLFPERNHADKQH